MAHLETLCSDRRDTKRIATNGRIFYRSNNGCFVRTEVLNLSSNGARLAMNNDVNTGSQVELALELEGGHFVSMRAQAVWSTPLPGGKRQVVGLRVAPVSVDQQSYSRYIFSN